MPLVLLAVADGGPLTAQIIETGLHLRSATGGVMDAVHVRDPAAFPTSVFSSVEGPAHMLDRSDALAQDRAGAVAKIWATQGAAVPGAALHTINGRERDLLVPLARVSDLTIMARPGGDKARPEPGYVNALIFETGKPVLVVPPAVQPNWTDDALVVWNRSAQAARALAGAMPLLKLAKSVTVASFGPEKSRADTDGVVAYLQRHGLPAKGVGIDTGGVTARGRGRAVIHYAWGTGAGFTVMGAYGEQALMGFLGLGGATAKAITGTRTPLLLAS